MKFYEGLTKEIKIGTDVRPAIFILKNGLWAWNERVEDERGSCKAVNIGSAQRSTQPLDLHSNAGLALVCPSQGYKQKLRSMVQSLSQLVTRGTRRKVPLSSGLVRRRLRIHKKANTSSRLLTRVLKRRYARYRPEAAKRQVSGKNQSTDQRD